MEIIRQQSEDGKTSMLIGGMAKDGKYRLARVTVAEKEATPDLMSKSAVSFQSEIDKGEYNEIIEARRVVGGTVEDRIARLELRIKELESMFGGGRF